MPSAARRLGLLLARRPDLLRSLTGQRGGWVDRSQPKSRPPLPHYLLTLRRLEPEPPESPSDRSPVESPSHLRRPLSTRKARAARRGRGLHRSPPGKFRAVLPRRGSDLRPVGCLARGGLGSQPRELYLGFGPVVRRSPEMSSTRARLASASEQPRHSQSAARFWTTALLLVEHQGVVELLAVCVRSFRLNGHHLPIFGDRPSAV